MSNGHYFSQFPLFHFIIAFINIYNITYLLRYFESMVCRDWKTSFQEAVEVLEVDGKNVLNLNGDDVEK